MFKNAVVVGYGSIGKRHAAHLLSISEKVYIYDPVKRVDEFESTGLHFLSNLTEKSIYPDPQDIAIIANWGPDHLASFEICVGLGFSNFVLEKPLTSSLADLYKLRALIANRKLNVIVKQGWESEKIGSRIRNLGFQLNLGEPVAMFVSGGARCISTAGSHNIHLASTVFDSLPNEVMGHLKNDYINPRNSTLSYIEGTCSILFEKNQRLSMSYSNRSSVQGKVEIYWKEAFGEFIDESKIKIFERNKNRAFANTITRYGPAEELVWNDKPPSEKPFSVSSLEKLYQEFSTLISSEFQLKFERHFFSNEALLRALISSAQGKVIRMNDSLDEAWSSMDFKIS
jgi:predicted dehydrogenase